MNLWSCCNKIRNWNSIGQICSLSLFSFFNPMSVGHGEKIKMVFFHFRAHTRIPWNSWWPVGIFASPSGKSVLNIMPFLDFSKNPNQSQSLFSSVEGHHFVSGKDSASRLTVCHVNIFPKTYLGYCLSQLLCCTVRRWGESQPLDADGLFAGIIPAGSWQTLTVLHLNVS